MASNGVYWLGADGQVYVKGSQGTNAAGKADANTVNYWNGKGFQQIADPNPPKQAAPANPNNTGGGTVIPDKSADIAFQQGQADSADTYQTSGLGAVGNKLGSVLGLYSADDANAKAAYTTNTNQNQNNLQKNKQTALVNAAAGRQGLNGTLASLGALNGTGITLANRAVEKGANDDLAGADDNYDTNAKALDDSFGEYQDEEKKREDAARQAADDASLGVKNTAASNKASALKSIADDYSDMGDKANATKYQQLASALLPTIASTAVPTSGPVYSGGAYTPQSLASYLAGNASTNVAVTPSANGGLPGLVATSTKKKALQPA